MGPVAGVASAGGDGCRQRNDRSCLAQGLHVAATTSSTQRRPAPFELWSDSVSAASTSRPRAATPWAAPGSGMSNAPVRQLLLGVLLSPSVPFQAEACNVAVRGGWGSPPIVT